MTQRRRYRCHNCGNRFEIEVLTEEEKREARRKNVPVYRIVCPKCNRSEVREGWD